MVIKGGEEGATVNFRSVFFIISSDWFRKKVPWEDNPKDAGIYGFSFFKAALLIAITATVFFLFSFIFIMHYAHSDWDRLAARTCRDWGNPSVTKGQSSVGPSLSSFGIPVMPRNKYIRPYLRFVSQNVRLWGEEKDQLVILLLDAAAAINVGVSYVILWMLRIAQ